MCAEGYQQRKLPSKYTTFSTTYMYIPCKRTLWCHTISSKIIIMASTLHGINRDFLSKTHTYAHCLIFPTLHTYLTNVLYGANIIAIPFLHRLIIMANSFTVYQQGRFSFKTQTYTYCLQLYNSLLRALKMYVLFGAIPFLHRLVIMASPFRIVANPLHCRCYVSTYVCIILNLSNSNHCNLCLFAHAQLHTNVHTYT